MNTAATSSRAAASRSPVQLLAGQPEVKKWMHLFHRATGLAIRLVSPDLKLSDGAVCGHEHDFCRKAGVRGSGICEDTRSALRRKVQRSLLPVAHTCATGMTEVAVPLVVDGRHLATFLVGQAFHDKPDTRSWDRLVKSMNGSLDRKRLAPLRAAYLDGQVIAPDALQPLVQMVALHARRLTRATPPAARKRAVPVAAKKSAVRRRAKR